MKVILLKSVPKVGQKDEIVEVAPGYAQHALFPKKFALEATPSAIAALNRRKQNIVAEREVRHTLLDQTISTLNDGHLTMRVKANEQGILFSKIDAADIATFLMKEHRISLDGNLITIVDGPIKKLGIYTLEVRDGEYHATFVIELVRQ